MSSQPPDRRDSGEVGRREGHVMTEEEEISLWLWESGGREPSAQECQESSQGRKGRDPALETQKQQPKTHLDLS